MDTGIGTDQLDTHESLLIGVKFSPKGQVFFFPSNAIDVADIKMGTRVIVETEQGLSMGEVCILSLFPNDKLVTHSEGKIIALATAEDLAKDAENHLLAAEAAAFCKSNIRERHLDMKLVNVQVMHDQSKFIFYFTAPSRIDFRDLVKDLVRTYLTRIELRQIGVRHETQMLGGLGNCGRVCCCHSYLRTFAPVTIKMAKEQNLFLNPAKLSGLCGRLLCCLSFEQNNYEEFNRRSPKLGKRYIIPLGIVKVIRTNMFAESLAVLTDSNEEKEFTLTEWEELSPRRSDKNDQSNLDFSKHTNKEASGNEKNPLPSGQTSPPSHESRPKKRRSN